MWPVESNDANPNAGAPRLINVPAKAAVMRAPEPPDTRSPQPDAGSEEDESEEKSLEWRRKARNRRLQANRQAGEGSEEPTAADYEPEFTALRKADWTPEFDQLNPDAVIHIGAPRVHYFDHRWSLLLLAGGMIAVFLALSTIVLLWYRKDVEEFTKAAGPKADELPGVVQEKAVKSTLEAVSEIKSVVSRFFAARTPEEKSALVRGGEALLPAMRSYYASHPDEPAGIHLTGSVKSIPDGGRLFFFVNGKDALEKPLEVVVERTPHGMKLDWRYLTGSGDMEWERWLKERPAVPVRLRVVASPDNYYAGAFANPGDWICIKITDPGGSSTAWAYAKRESDAAVALVLMFAGGRTNLRVQGLFEFPPEDERTSPSAAITPQVFLRSVDDRGWLDRSPELGYPASTSNQQKDKAQ